MKPAATRHDTPAPQHAPDREQLPTVTKPAGPPRPTESTQMPKPHGIGLVVPARAPEELADFWDEFASRNTQTHAAAIAEAAAQDEGMLYACLRHRFLTAKDVLTAPGSDLTPLFTGHRATIFDAIWTPYFEYLAGAASRGWGSAVHSGLPITSDQHIDEDFAALGNWLVNHPCPPWLSVNTATRYEALGLFHSTEFIARPGRFQTANPATSLGIYTALLITAEMTRYKTLEDNGNAPLGAYSDLCPYILRRWDRQPDAPLPELPVPEHFQRLFTAWANKEICFIKPSTCPHP